MATNNPNTLIAAVLMAIAAGVVSAVPARARETASPAACKAAGASAPILDAKTTLDHNPDDLHAHFALADAWSDAGCFSDAVQVLQRAESLHSGSKELETRLRVAKSLIGEENFFDDLDRANADARLKRDIFRCTSLADTAACAEAVAMRPGDASLRSAQTAALQKNGQPGAAPPAGAASSAAGALSSGGAPAVAALPARAAPHSGFPNSGSGAARGAPALSLARATAVTAQGRRYSNAPAESQSH